MQKKGKTPLKFPTSNNSLAAEDPKWSVDPYPSKKFQESVSYWTKGFVQGVVPFEKYIDCIIQESELLCQHTNRASELFRDESEPVERSENPIDLLSEDDESDEGVGFD